MPRHDTLLEKNLSREKDEGHKKTVFISFHWRTGKIDKDPESFKGSMYLKGINSLLNSSKLKEMVESDGIRVYFMPHAKFLKYINDFAVPDYIEIPKDKPFQDILVESDLIITDFSSNSLEMAYMDKPTIVYVPDKRDVLQTCPQYSIDAVKNYANMTYCETQDKVFSKMKELMDGKYDFSKTLFKYVDTDNTKRLVEWMLKTVEKKSMPDRKPSKEEIRRAASKFVRNMVIGGAAH